HSFEMVGAHACSRTLTTTESRALAKLTQAIGKVGKIEATVSPHRKCIGSAGRIAEVEFAEVATRGEAGKIRRAEKRADVIMTVISSRCRQAEWPPSVLALTALAASLCSQRVSLCLPSRAQLPLARALSSPAPSLQALLGLGQCDAASAPA